MACYDHLLVALSDLAIGTRRRCLIAIRILASSLPGQTLKQIATIDLARMVVYEAICHGSKQSLVKGSQNAISCATASLSHVAKRSID